MGLWGEARDDHKILTFRRVKSASGHFNNQPPAVKSCGFGPVGPKRNPKPCRHILLWEMVKKHAGVSVGPQSTFDFWGQVGGASPTAGAGDVGASVSPTARPGEGAFDRTDSRVKKCGAVRCLVLEAGAFIWVPSRATQTHPSMGNGKKASVGPPSTFDSWGQGTGMEGLSKAV